jgi:hypothetical protein
MHIELIAAITEIPTGTPDPLHSVVDPEKRDAIAADMAANGWIGAPIVILSETQALTGAHRIAASIEADYVPVPQVDVSDLCDAYGINWAELVDGHYDDWYLAASALRDLLPSEVVEYLGYDVDGE